MMAIGLIAYSQKIDKSQVPMHVKNTYLTKADTSSATWEKAGEEYIATAVKGEMISRIFISSTGEWKKSIFTIPYQYVPQKIKDNIVKDYPGFKVSNSFIQYRSDGDFYLIETKKKKEMQTVKYTIKGEFVKVFPGADENADVKK